MQARSGGERKTFTLPKGMYQTAEFVAAKTVKCLRRPRGEVWTGLGGLGVRTGMALAIMFPGPADWALTHMSARRR